MFITTQNKGGGGGGGGGGRGRSHVHTPSFFFPTQIHTEKSGRAQTYETARNRERDEHGSVTPRVEGGTRREAGEERHRRRTQKNTEMNKTQT